MTTAKGPLDGLIVVDLSRVLAGPYSTMLLADMGATVIKVESPGGDDTRAWTPPEHDGTSTYYLSINRNKQSIVLDFRNPDDIAVVHDLFAEADIVVENFKVGSLAKKGLDYDGLRAIKPDIIYASITGFGQDGPMAEQPGYDYLAQAMAGMMSVTGRADGEPGAGPLRAGIATADQASGMYATVGILAALRHRDQSGEGQHVDVSLFDSQLAFMINQALNYFVGGTPPTRSGEWHPNLAPYQPFDVADGRVIIAVGNNRQFAALCGWLGLDSIPEDARFVENPDRNRHRVELAGLLQAELRTRTKAETLAALPSLGVPAAKINDLAEAFDEPQAKHRGGRIELPHSTAGTAPGIANPLHLSASPITYRNAPPTLGEHTDEVLRDDLGLSDSEISKLRSDSVV